MPPTPPISHRARVRACTQVSEERVADAERLNSITVDSINKLRRGRSDFLQQMSRLTERIAIMSADMKHFAQAAHASLDEKEKVEARLKRQQFDYQQEGRHYEHMFDSLQAELHSLEEKIAHGYARTQPPFAPAHLACLPALPSRPRLPTALAAAPPGRPRGARLLKIRTSQFVV